MDPRLQSLVDELTAGIAFLRSSAAGKLETVISANPGASEIELLQAYESEVRAALPTVDIANAIVIAQRAFAQLRSGKTGYNPGHAGID